MIIICKGGQTLVLRFNVDKAIIIACPCDSITAHKPSTHLVNKLYNTPNILSVKF